MMKRCVPVVMLIMMLLSLHAAAAQTVGFGEKVQMTGGTCYTVDEWTWQHGDRPGMIDLWIRLTVSRTDDAERDSVAADEFMLIAAGERRAPDAVSLDCGNLLQPVVFPIRLGAEPVSFCLAFSVPAELTQLALVSDGGRFETEFRRTVLDVEIVNGTDRDAKELYLVPADERFWGANLLDHYVDNLLEKNGDARCLDFADTAYAERTGESWMMRVVFADGSSAEFSDISLEDVTAMILYVEETETEEGETERSYGLTFCP